MTDSNFRAPEPIPTDGLRWNCDPAELGFQTTAEVPPIGGIVGQDDAVDALRFGLETFAPGQNIFVRGLAGTGRLTTVGRLLREIQPACPLASDYAYVHNFQQPDRPALLVLPRGTGKRFRELVDHWIEFVAEEFSGALFSESLHKRRAILDEELQRTTVALSQPFEKELRENELAMVTMQGGPSTHPVLLPILEGEPAPPERIQQLLATGGLTEEKLEEIRETIQRFSQSFQELSRKLQDLRSQHVDRVRELIQGEARALLGSAAAAIQAEFGQEDVAAFVASAIEDVVTRRLHQLKEGTGFVQLYRVNLILEHAPDAPCPIVIENTPTLTNLLGSIDRQVLPNGAVSSDHTMISSGSLLRADGGYLVIESREVLSEPGAWKALIRTLRSGKLEIAPPDRTLPWGGRTLKPQAIPLNVKVVLIGDPGIYQALDSMDPDFPQLFKVLADFETTIERNAESLQFYAGVLARLAADENLPDFEAGAVAALAEHGARIAARNDRLTTRFGRLADLAREAAFLCSKGTESSVSASNVWDAIQRSRRRADLPARRFRKHVAEGSIRIETQGKVVGQVNGLAVISAGPLTYGFPTRITATIGPGSAGTINIERESQLSGAIHTKGFYILGGLLRHLLRTEHPLAFSASIAFEQSYGGIDGDSASGAEMCCLLSALTDVPLRQDLAMTGAIDQHGHIQPIGAATEKIEGFYDTCKDLGLTGTQGVIVPSANLHDLMLRRDVVEACAAGRFHVYAVDTIQQALELFTGMPAGERSEGEYPEDSLLGQAVERAFAFWTMVAGGSLLQEAEDDSDPEDAADSEDAS